MKLYYFQTPNARKACAVAKHLALPVEYVFVDLSKGEQKIPDYLTINPNGRVPALQDGNNTVWESPAVMCYLAQKAGSDMWPSDGAAQVEILRWLSWDTAHFSRHAGRLFWERYIKPAFGLGDANPDEIDDATGYFKIFAEVLNDYLKGRRYLVGDHLTIADFATAAMLPTAIEAQLPLEGFSEIIRWHDSLMELPAWREPFPA